MQAHSSEGSHHSSRLLELRMCGVSDGHLFHGRIDGASTERQNRAGCHSSLVQSLSRHHHMLVIFLREVASCFLSSLLKK